MLLVVSAVAALSGPTGHSRRAAPLPARRDYCDVNGCVVPESADESSSFGGIIAPPWWDDFQEP